MSDKRKKPKKDLKRWFTVPKNILKMIKSFIELVIIIVVAVLLARAIFDKPTYVSLNDSAYNSDNGFIAISYFGVDRSQKPTLIDDDLLAKHLKALKRSGYETITQQNVIDYLAGKKSLPEKALFLTFEDGRRDSAMFSQKYLQELNYKASMLTYAGKFAEKDNKFLQPKDLKEIEKNGFWELGTNGYRFYYINVFDRYGNYIGIMNQDQYNINSEYIDYDYNHYLMDFIRDADRVPLETRTEMEERIKWDYDETERIYKSELGEVPELYMVMHANNLHNGANALVDNANWTQIERLFKLHFNLESSCVNDRNTDPLNMTRMQPQPFWSTNHLLMHIYADTHSEPSYETGNEEKARKWVISDGVAEFEQNQMILTNISSLEAKAEPKDNFYLTDCSAHVRAEGNTLGHETLRLRNNKENGSYVEVSLEDGYVHIRQRPAGQTEKTLISTELRRFDGRRILSVNEAEAESRRNIKKIDTARRDTLDRAKTGAERKLGELTGGKTEELPTVDDGAKEYVPKMPASQKANRKIDASLLGNKLTVLIDGKPLVTDFEIDGSIQEGGICLLGEASRSASDNVYDAIFSDFYVEDAGGNVIHDMRLKNLEKAVFDSKNWFNSVIDWFIEKL